MIFVGSAHEDVSGLSWLCKSGGRVAKLPGNNSVQCKRHEGKH